jgi:hypothetical protein
MADDSNNMSTEARHEALELDPSPKPAERRGYESLRGVRRSSYVRRSLLRMLSKAPEELEAYSPKNGFELVSRNMILASNSRDRSAAVAVAVFKEVKEALGEKVGTNSRQTVEERQRQMPTVVADLPWKDYSHPWNADDEKGAN